MSTETVLKPKARPSNLPEVTDVPADPPLPIPSNTSDEPTLEWAEKCRDHFEEKGQLLTVAGLLKMVGTAGLSDGDAADMKKQVRRLYADEHTSGQSKAPPKAKTVSKPKPKKKETKVSATTTTTTTTAPSKSKSKGKAKKKVAAKPSKNGHTANGTSGLKTVYSGTVRGVPVFVGKTDDGRLRATAFGIPFRGILRWLGNNNVAVPEARTCCETLLKGYKGGAEYVGDMIEEGHVGAGRKADKKGNTVFGPVPNLTKDQGRALKALAK